MNLPGPIAFDAGNNRIFISNIRTITTQPKLVTYNLSTLSKSTFLNLTLGNPAPGLDIDSTLGYLYYVVSDGSATSTTDAVHRINLDGSGDIVLATSFINTPRALVLDKPNNRLLIVDARLGSSTVTPKIRALALSANLPSVFLNLASTSQTMAGVALAEQDPTVTTRPPVIISSTSASLGGDVTAAGSAVVTERGVVYSSTNVTPTLANATKVTMARVPAPSPKSWA
ncbi:hypothetical protein [Hymenobacter terrenus]|uniref:hypothetical protein n=1 Tax=Hymenobacter terrenus TaxID=1629124 RepID=UPI0012E04BDA|nr:hypothetical protein [Hymenobacter terrenus]